MNAEMMKELLNNAITEDTPFKFHCTQCGKCCLDREDILLNPYDLYRIAKGENYKPEDIVSKYCDVFVGHTSHFPLVKLKSFGKKKACPFLSCKKCSIQDHKPLVCALYPLGRA